jgi:5,10-methenyltetrahydromethanopterin hydrogenase
MANAHGRAEEAVHKIEDLEHTAEVGESAKTPLILLGDVWVVAAAVVAVVLLLSLIAYWLA